MAKAGVAIRPNRLRLKSTVIDRSRRNRRLVASTLCIDARDIAALNHRELTAFVVGTLPT